MKQSSQISLIHPFYGDLPLLDRFLDSTCKQEIDGIEAIIVANKECKPCNGILAKFARAGLSIATCCPERHLQPLETLAAGIEIATAPTIALFPWGGFFPGRKNLSNLLEKSQQCGADIFQYRELRIDETGIIHNDLPYAFACKPLNGQEIAKCFIGNSYFFHSVSSKLFSRSLLQTIAPLLKLMPEQTYFDDSLFLLPCMAHAHVYAEDNLPGHTLYLGEAENCASLFARSMATFLALKNHDNLAATCKFQPDMHHKMLDLLQFLSASYCGKMCANMTRSPGLFARILPPDLTEDFFVMLFSSIHHNAKKLGKIRTIIKSVQA